MSDSATQKTLMTRSSVFTLGGYPDENAYFNGNFDELRIWNVAHSATEITANMKKILVGNEAGLVGYWKFDETSGTTAADSVTTTGHTPHNGTLKAANAGMIPTWVTGAPGLMCP